MTLTILIAVIGFVAAIITGLVSWAVARRRNSGNIDTSDAASLWTESTQMRKDLRNEVDGLRKELKEAGMKFDAAVLQINGLLREIAFANTAIANAREETRTAREETAQLRAVINDVHAEVKTYNALTMGVLADNQESRRIMAIPPELRTPGETEHLNTVGVKEVHNRDGGKELT